MINYNKNITIKVEGQKLNNSLQLTLNWDADLDDWVTAFKTILMHQTFTEDSIKEVFESAEENIQSAGFEEFEKNCKF